MYIDRKETEDDFSFQARQWLEDCTSKHSNNISSQLNKILKEIADSTAEWCRSHHENPGEVESKLYDAKKIIESIMMALDAERWKRRERLEKLPDIIEAAKEIEKEDFKQEHMIWQRKDLLSAFYQGYESRHYFVVSAQELSHEVANYLERPWMKNRFLEWSMLEGFIAGETAAFGEELKKKPPKPSIWNFLDLDTTYFQTKGNLTEMGKKRLQRHLLISIAKAILFGGIPAALVWWWFTHGHQDAAIFGGFAYVSFWAVIKIIGLVRRLFGGKQVSPHEKAVELWQQMAAVYQLLEGPVVNPQRVYEAMVKSAEKGAVWSSAAYALVDRIRAEYPTGWVMSEGYAYGATRTKYN